MKRFLSICGDILNKCFSIVVVSIMFLLGLISIKFKFIVKTFLITVVSMFCLSIIYMVGFDVVSYNQAYKDKPISLKLQLVDYGLNAQALSFITSSSLRESKLAFKLRKDLFNKYKNISSKFDEHDYSSVSFFYYVDRDYRDLLSVKSKNNLYELNQYKEYVQEIENILNDYEKITKVDATTLIDVPSFLSFPNKRMLYLSLLDSYVSYSLHNKNDVNVEKVKKLFEKSNKITAENLDYFQKAEMMRKVLKLNYKIMLLN